MPEFRVQVRVLGLGLGLVLIDVVDERARVRAWVR